MSYAALANNNNNGASAAAAGGGCHAGRRGDNRYGIATSSDGNQQGGAGAAAAVGVAGYAETRRVPLIPRQDQVFQAHYFVPVHVHPDFVVLRAWG